MYIHNKITSHIALSWLVKRHYSNKIRIFGYMVTLSTLIVILCTWISSELHGAIYFSAGEPNRAILYIEWIFIAMAIIIIANEFRKSLIEAKTKVIYDLPV